MARRNVSRGPPNQLSPERGRSVAGSGKGDGSTDPLLQQQQQSNTLSLSGRKPKSSGAVYPPYYKNATGTLPPYVREGDIEYPFEDITGVGDENKIRGNWSSKVDYYLSALGFVVGLGNIWRFPYYCYMNGGGVFLIPYLTMLVIIGMPMFFMELVLGQFSSLGCISVWKVVPLFKGVGIAMFLVSCVTAIYYNMVTAWSIYYLISSLQLTVPWATCDNDWNTEQCSVWSRDTVNACLQANGTVLRNGTCMPTSLQSIDGLLLNVMLYNETELAQPFDSSKMAKPSLEFFRNQVLMISAGADQIGTINWQLALYLLAAWMLVFFALFQGVKTGGKVVYLTTVAPYVVLLVLLVRILTLPGSVDGLLYFASPKWEMLLNLKIWGDAAVQVFYSLSCCWGGLLTLSSYNRFHNDCFKDMWWICIGDAVTSIFTSCVTFATVGFMAYEWEIPISEVDLKTGPGLTFVIYSEAIAKLPVAPLCAVLFFSALIMLTVTTVFFVVETVVTAICDEFPERLRRNHRHVVTFVCVIFYALGIPLCTQAGIYWVQLLDYYTPTWSLILVAFFECMAIGWVYGVDNFLDNVKWMISYYPAPYMLWKVLWKFFCPVLLMAILSFVWLEYRPVTFGAYEYPYWTNSVGWCISMVPVAMIPLTALIQFCFAKGTFLQRWRDLMSPDDDWGPALAIHRAEYFPLQIPEARRPVDPPPYTNGDLPYSYGIGGGADAKSDPNLLTSPLAEPFGVPSFDRETAI